MSKTVYKHLVTDGETGEVIKRSHVTAARSKLPDHEPFVKLFIADVAKLENLKPGHFKVLHSLAYLTDYEGNVWVSPQRRKEMAVSHGINERTVQNIISQLVGCGMLVKLGMMQYQLNPHYFGRGDWSAILLQRENFSLKIRYSDAGREATLVREPAAIYEVKT